MKSVLVGACALVTAGAMGETYTLANAGSGEDPHAFYKTAAWINGQGDIVQTSPSKGNVYVVDSGRILNCDTAKRFAGDSLTFGHVGGTEGVFMHSNANTVEVPNLILEKGFYRTWRQDPFSTAELAGNITVNSPATAAFRIYPTHDAGQTSYVMDMTANIRGAVGTGLFLGPHPNSSKSQPTVNLKGDNSQYFGCFEIAGTNMLVNLCSNAALGGPLNEFDAQSVVLRNRAVLAPGVAKVTLVAADNRGICVKANGGCLRAEAGRELRIEWPFSGWGVVEKLGSGTVTLASSWGERGTDHSESLAISEGTIVFADGFSKGAANVMSVKAAATVGVAAGDTIEVSGLALEDGATFRVFYDAVTQKSGVLVLPDGLDAAKTYQVIPPAEREVTVPFLKVPTTKGTVTAANFKMSDDLALQGNNHPTAMITVEEQDGFYVVFCKTLKLVSQIDTKGQPAYLSEYEPGRWSDNKIPHDGADYELVGTNVLKRLGSTGNPDDFVFPGGYISLYGGSASRYVRWDLQGHSMTADIRAGQYTQIYVTSTKTYDTFTLDGKLHVGNNVTADQGLSLYPDANKILVNFDIASRVTGSGAMSMQSTAANQQFNVSLLNANNIFSGQIFLYADKNNSILSLRFKDGSNFGVNPPAKTDGTRVLLQANSGGIAELHPIGSASVNLLNREFVFFTGNCRVRVDDGETFELVSPMSFKNSSVLTKLGYGVWAVGGAVTVANSPSVKISEGYVRADNARAFVSLPLTIAEGAGIAAKYRPGATDEASQYGLLVTDAAKFTVAGGTVAFMAEMPAGTVVKASMRVPLLTVPPAVAAVLDTKKLILVQNVDGRQGVVEKDEVTIGDVQYVRYSGKFRRGFLLSVR